MDLTDIIWTEATDARIRKYPIQWSFDTLMLVKADTCDDLWSGCSDIIHQLTDKSQVHGAKSVALCGGVSGKSFCRNLGYPLNSRPF